MGKLFDVKLFGKQYYVQNTLRSTKSGKFLDEAVSILSPSIRNLKTNKFEPIGKLTGTLMKGAGGTVCLAKTPGFGVVMLATALISGGIGALLGKNWDNKTKAEDMPEQQEKEHTPVPAHKEMKPVAKVKAEEKEDYHTIKTGGLTWAGIVNAYYPKLVEKCDGKMYGCNGAIRKLKEELSKCCDYDLINMSDIPPLLNLPLEIAGAEIDKNAKPKKEKITNKGGHTDLQEAGCKNKKIIYTVSDGNYQYTDDNLNKAMDSLKVHSGVKDYELDYVS